MDKTIYINSSQNWMTLYSPYPRISNCSSKSYSTGREKRVGVRDRSNVAKYNKMPYSIHSKHYTVAIRYYPSPNMARHSYKSKCNCIQTVGNENQSNYILFINN